MSNADIVHHNGGTTISGPDGMLFYRAITVRASLRMYAKSGMKSTRMATPANMFAIAKEFTGKDYKRGQYQQAIDDLTVWIDTMRGGLQVEDERTKEKA